MTDRPMRITSTSLKQQQQLGFGVLFGKQISWNRNVFFIYWIIRSIGVEWGWEQWKSGGTEENRNRTDEEGRRVFSCDKCKPSSVVCYSLSIEQLQGSDFLFLGRTGWRLILCHSVDSPICGIKIRLDDLILLSLLSSSPDDRSFVEGVRDKGRLWLWSLGANLGDWLDFSGSYDVDGRAIWIIHPSWRLVSQSATHSSLSSFVWGKWRVGGWLDGNELILKMMDCCCLVFLFRSSLYPWRQ